MTIQDFIKKGHKWIELKGVPVRDSHSEAVMYIHNKFFEGKELEFQNELISNFMKLCPTKEWSWRVYGGDTPDADMVDWIYTQTAEIVSGDESENNQEFFTNGTKYRCIKSVVMKKGGKTAFKAGSIYEQTNEPTYWVGWLRNEQGDRHAWPQPVYIADTVKTWGSKLEDIDPRNYFEPVEDGKSA